MPRSTLAKRSSTTFDKTLELRNHQLAAIGASTTETGIAFASGPQDEYIAVCFAQSYTNYTLDINEWQIIIEISTTLAGTYRQIGIAKLPPGSEVQVPLSGVYAESNLPAAQFIRARAIRVGAPGNLTYGAYLATEAC
jgi:hypothetical protein